MTDITPNATLNSGGSLRDMPLIGPILSGRVPFIWLFLVALVVVWVAAVILWGPVGLAMVPLASVPVMYVLLILVSRG